MCIMIPIPDPPIPIFVDHLSRHYIDFHTACVITTGFVILSCIGCVMVWPAGTKHTVVALQCKTVLNLYILLSCYEVSIKPDQVFSRHRNAS